MLWLWGQRATVRFDPYTATVAEQEETEGIFPYFPLQTTQGLLYNLGGENRACRVGYNGKPTCRILQYARPFQLLASTADDLIWLRAGEELILSDADFKPLRRVRLPAVGEIDVARLGSEGQLILLYENIQEGAPRQLVLATPDGTLRDLVNEWQLPGPPQKIFFESGPQHVWLEYPKGWMVLTLDGHPRFQLSANDSINPEIARTVFHSWGHTNDQEGALWLCTEHGISRLRSRHRLFQKWQDEATGRPVSFRGIHVDEEGIVACAELDGVYESAPDGKLVPIPELSPWINYLAGRGLGTTMNAKRRSDFRGIFRSEAGQYWLGQQRAILRYDPVTKTVKPYPPAFTYDVEWGLNPWSLFECTDGTLLVGGHPGLMYIPPGQDSLQKIVAPPPFEMLNEAAIYRILPRSDAGQGYWLATSRGLFALDDQFRVTRRYHSGADSPFYLPDDDVYALQPASFGRLWLGFNGNGLLLLNPETGTRKQWTRRQGLSDDVIYGLFQDEYHALWLASDIGLMRLDTQTNLVQTFLEGDGLPDREFNRTSNFRRSDGQLYFGTINGLVEFHPRAFTRLGGPTTSSVSVQRLQKRKKGNGPFQNLTRELFQDSTIQIHRQDQEVQLQLSLPDFEGLPPRFAFRIGDQSFQYIEGNVLQLGRYPYGRHRLEIIGYTADGRRADPLVLSILAVRPWFLQWWFILLAFCLAIGLGFAGQQLRLASLLRQRKELQNKVASATARLRQDRNLIRRQASELKRVDELKTRFFANISHELRTPLTLIIGPLRSLGKKANLTDQDRNFVRLAEANAAELLRTVNSILDLAKMDSKGIDLRESPVHVRNLLEELVEKFHLRAQQKGIDLRLRVPDRPLGDYLLDGEKTQTILQNLLTNAIKYTGADQQVILSLEITDTKLRFTVRDTGRGISEEDLPYLFDRFYQSARTSPGVEGTGIGLSLSAEFAALMNGELIVNSELGRGSTFTLLLPAKPAGTNTEPTPPAPVVPLPFVNEPERPENPDRPLVLVVEDNLGMQTYLTEVLNEQYRIRTTGNGEQALRLLDDINFLPELIITDLMMPEMDGFTLIKILKERLDTRQIPLIVLSARGSVSDRISVLRYGIDDYVTKPFDADELLLRIRRLLQNQRSRIMEPSLNENVDGTSGATTTLEEPPQWLADLEQTVIDHLDDSRLSAAFLAELNHVSTRQFQRWLRAATGQTPGGYIKEVRLNEALRLLETGEEKTVKSVAAAVGFKKADYFSKVFRERFGRSPSSYG